MRFIFAFASCSDLDAYLDKSAEFGLNVCRLRDLPSKDTSPALHIPRSTFGKSGQPFQSFHKDRLEAFCSS